MRPLQTPIFCQQVYLLATKVSFHPMAKVFSLCERILVLFQCGLVETQKVIFFYTSCHPYGSILAPKSSPIWQAMISMPTNVKFGLWYESIHLLEQVCSLLKAVKISWYVLCKSKARIYVRECLSENKCDDIISHIFLKG